MALMKTTGLTLVLLLLASCKPSHPAFGQPVTEETVEHQILICEEFWQRWRWRSWCEGEVARVGIPILLRRIDKAVSDEVSGDWGVSCGYALNATLRFAKSYRAEVERRCCEVERPDRACWLKLPPSERP